MRNPIRLALCLSLSVVVGVATTAMGEGPIRHSTAPPGSAIAGSPAPQYTFMLFWKQQDAATRQFNESLQSAAAKRPEQATCTAIQVTDQANQSVVAHYGVSRAPMPLAICVADNGAVTGVFTRQPNVEALERAMVTSAMATVTKALQDRKIVIVHVKPAADAALPDGAAQFLADPDFHQRTAVIDVVLDDPAESRFLADMEIDPRSVSDSLLVIMAPPAALVGKFASNATKAQIVAKLHAAGKCCNDPNCNHQQKGN